MSFTRTNQRLNTAKLLLSRGPVHHGLYDKLSDTLALLEVFVWFSEELVDLLVEFVGVLDQSAVARVRNNPKVGGGECSDRSGRCG